MWNQESRKSSRANFIARGIVKIWNEQTEARALYEEAIVKAATRYDRFPRPDAAHALIRAESPYAEYFIRLNDDPSAEMQYRKVLDAAQSYSGSYPTSPEFAAAKGNALNSLGDLYLKRGDRIKAAASYDQGAVAVRRQITLEGDKPTVSWVELLAFLYRMAGEQRRFVNDPDGAIDRFTKALGALNLIAPDQITPEIHEEAAVTNAEIVHVERARSNSASAEKAVTAALAEIAQVLASQAPSADLKQKARELKSRIETP